MAFELPISTYFGEVSPLFCWSRVVDRRLDRDWLTPVVELAVVDDELI